MSEKSFILHKDSLLILDKLTDLQAGQLFKAIKTYQEGGQLCELDFAIDIAFSPFLNQFKRDSIKYKNTCEARRLAGSMGGKQKLANASKCKQKVANLAESDSKNKKDSDSDSKKVGFKKPMLEEVQNYCNERNNNLDARKFFDYYETGNWKDGTGKQIKNWKQKVITWEKRSDSDKAIIIKPNKTDHNKAILQEFIKRTGG